MPQITLLDQETIDKIAAGEVVERPSSVVKELVENAIDAKATAVTVEIKEGGTSFIRITDNGCGIEKKQVKLAFLRHSTSKIKSVEDLLSIHSLGFRGEALSSIAAVSQVELITKTYDELTGTRYVIEGSKEKELEEIGAPDGTTFIVRNLFYNTPARRKFLKSAQTEGNYVADLMERMALSHPDVSFKFINNGQTKMHTSGNSNEKDLIYHIYGRDITSAILPIDIKNEHFHVKGFIGKPAVTRGNRNFESFFINGRYIKSALLSKAVEEAYKGFIMQHQYPFCVLYFAMDSNLLDVNVHPTKMELRFSQNDVIYRELFEIIRNALTHKEFIPEVPVKEEKKTESRPQVKSAPEPFEIRRINDIRKSVSIDSPYERQYPDRDRLAQRAAQNAGNKAFGQEKNNVSTSAGDEAQSLSHAQETIAKQKEQPSATSQAATPQMQKPQVSPQSDSRKTAEALFASLSGKSTEAKPKEALNEQAEERKSEDKERTSVSKEITSDVKEAALDLKEAVSEFSESTAEKETATQITYEEPSETLLVKEESTYEETVYEQQNLSDMSEQFLTKDARKKHQIVGQLFDTYWMVEYEDKLFIIDQHAAHEKVLYEKTMAKLETQSFSAQTLSPPIILTLSNEEVEMLEKYRSQIEAFGYEVEHFGGKEYSITAIPADFTGIDMKSMFIDMLDDFANITGKDAPNLIMEKVASMSCKAAVKGHDHLSRQEAEQLIDELLELENPYHCPHGRPTIISMTKYEIEKKFKRIV